MENVKKYNVIFMEVFSVGEEVLNDEFKQGNVENWNSIHQLNLVSYIEESFDVMLDTEDILGLTSYSKGKEILVSKYNINF
ncbi:acyl carrier protein [Butyricimonas virosa]|uniref:Acyl carrier protein n=1 Tax=Butyricimonas virosa TaxID=544645 RepID=A0A412WZ86_9BACT|nr:acyl carrier protein [Butyricimonas virosa]MBS5625952.1 acyl carrier protein [Porphyromonadaceae bacterium]MCI7162874.1 acyl carrier protein [Butyricimonas virosa]MDY5013062.1 acyl carrier protein [Butyricimonas virosa]RGV33117.1 acyl carrier protein [Butyricimonas virosa]